MKWFSIGKKIPDEGELVLVVDMTDPEDPIFSLDVRMDPVKGTEFEGAIIWIGQEEGRTYEVTHWAYLTPPKK